MFTVVMERQSDMLNNVYTLFDRMSEQHNVYKVLDRQSVIEDKQHNAYNGNGQRSRQTR